jgi:hypothetical protein
MRTSWQNASLPKSRLIPEEMNQLKQKICPNSLKLNRRMWSAI